MFLIIYVSNKKLIWFRLNVFPTKYISGIGTAESNIVTAKCVCKKIRLYMFSTMTISRKIPFQF